MTELLVKKKTTTLDQIIEEIPPSNITQVVRELCDIIMKEEVPRMKNMKSAPKGPNKFLILEVPGFLKREIGFLSLEREAEEDYLGVYWTFRLGKAGAYPKKVKVHKIEGNTAKKIMYQFAKLVKFYRGE